jgi:hypothetical protein
LICHENFGCLHQFNSLPDSLKDEVLDFVKFLKLKAARQNRTKDNRHFSQLKGKIRMSEDFDKPLVLR